MKQSDVEQMVKTSQGALGLGQTVGFHDYGDWSAIELDNGNVFHAYQYDDGMTITFINPTRFPGETDRMDYLPGERR